MCMIKDTDFDNDLYGVFIFAENKNIENKGEKNTMEKKFTDEELNTIMEVESVLSEIGSDIDDIQPEDLVGYLDENSTEEEIEAQMEADDKLMYDDEDDLEEDNLLPC